MNTTAAESNLARAARLLRRPLLALCLATALVPQVQAQDPDASAESFSLRRRSHANDFAMFRSIDIPADTEHPGDVVCLFGDVTIAGTVKGEVVVIFGNLRVEGQVEEDTVAVLSNVAFGPKGRLGGDFVNVLGTLTGEAQIAGDTVQIPLFFAPKTLWAPFGMLGTLLTWIAVIWSAVIFLLMVVLSAAVPDRVRRITDELPARLPLAFLVGLGAYVGTFLVNAALLATFIGIPLAGLLYVLFLVLKWLGMAGIYHWVGRGIGRLFGRELSLLPAVLLGFLPFALLQLAPVFLGGFGLLIALGVRVLLWLLIEIPAIGLAVLTRGGGRPRATTQLTIPVVPVGPVVPAPSAAG